MRFMTGKLATSLCIAGLAVLPASYAVDVVDVVRGRA